MSRKIIGFSVKRPKLKHVMAIITLCVMSNQSVFGQELSCDTSVAPSSFQKAIQKARHNPVVKNKIGHGFSKAQAASVYPAKIVALKGDVRLLERNSSEVTPLQLAEDATLFLHDVIATGPRSFASVRYGDGSINVLPPNAKIRLNQASKSIARVELLRGEVESQIKKTPSATRNTFEIVLPTATIGVRGTHFRVKEDNMGGLVEVEEGVVRIVKRNACVPPQIIKAGMAAQILANSGAVHVETLLPPPDLLNLENAKRKDANMEFTVKPLDGAARYRLQIAEDSRFTRIQKEAYSDATNFEMNNDDLQDGFYYVRVSGIDKKGIEGQTGAHLFLRNRQADSRWTRFINKFK